MLFVFSVPILFGIALLPIYSFGTIEILGALSLLQMFINSFITPVYLLEFTKKYTNRGRLSLQRLVIISFMSLYLSIILEYLGWGLAGGQMLNPYSATVLMLISVALISSLILAIGILFIRRDIKDEVEKR